MFRTDFCLVLGKVNVKLPFVKNNQKSTRFYLILLDQNI